jgi:O-antigen/teichoic acid export membrane protein
MRQAIPSLVIMVGTTLAFQSDRIVLSHRATPTDLAKYALGSQFYAPAWSVVVAAGLAMWPVFSANRRDRRASSDAFYRFLRVFGLLAGTFGVGLVVVGPAVARLVSGGKVGVGHYLMLAFALVLVVQGCQLVPGMFLTDTGGLRLQAVCVLAMMLLNLAVSWHLAASMGAVGPLIGTAFSVFLLQLIPGVIVVRRRLSRNELTYDAVTLATTTEDLACQ